MKNGQRNEVSKNDRKERIEEIRQKNVERKERKKHRRDKMLFQARVNCP